MRSSSTRALSISALALLAVLAQVSGGYATTLASAASANTPRADSSLLESGIAGDVESSAKRPTLTNDIGQPSDGAEWQLPVGIGLLAVGLLGLLCGHAAIVSTRRRVLAHAVRAPTPRRTRRDTTMTRQTGSGG